MKKITILSLLVVSLLASCSSNEMAKNYGGTMTVTLPPNQKLLNVTWKDANLWYLTREMKVTDSLESYTFQEKSELGIQEGTVIFIESKK